jgi:DNA-binding NarL/FixJ family response regulator
MPSATTLIIIHPRELLCLGLLSVFKGQAGFKVLGQGSTGKEAQKLTKQHEPNLILLYDQLDDQDSFDLAKQLKESNPDLKIVMLGVQDNTTYMARAASAGVHNYLSEGSTGRQIVDTIRDSVVAHKPHCDLIVSVMKEEFALRGVHPLVEWQDVARPGLSEK